MPIEPSRPPDPRAGLERMEAYLRGERSTSGIAKLLDFRPTSVAAGTMGFTATPTVAHYNPGGTVHGGYITTLLDTAMGCAAITKLGAAQGVTTLELKVNFLRAVTLANGPVQAVGTVTRHGRRVVFTEATLTDGAGHLLATASSTLLVLEHSPQVGG